MRLLLTALFLLSATLPCFGDETRFVSMKEHMIYGVIQKNAEAFKAGMAAHPVENQAVKLVAGKSAVEVTDHYLGMVDFLAENIPSGTMYNSNAPTDMGNGASGYVVARTYLTEQDLDELNQRAPQAFDHYKEKNGEMDWAGWVKEFDGDSNLALKAIVYHSGWVRQGLFIGDPSSKEKIYAYRTTVDYYDMYPLKIDAFGLNMSSGRNLNYSANSWGKAYKTVAGMNMALAAKSRGYSDSDIRAMVSRANLVYESSDLLYDHLGLHRDGIAQSSDSSGSDKTKIQAAYQDFAQKLREQMKADPALLKRMIGSIFGLPALGRLLPDSARMNTEDDLVLVFLLLNYKLEAPKAFEHDVGPLFGDTENGKKVKSLFGAGIKDTRIVMAGGDFVIEKLEKVPLEEINPCLQEKPFQGVLGLTEDVKGILSFFENGS